MVLGGFRSFHVLVTTGKMVFTFPFLYGTRFAGRGKKFHTTKYKGCALRPY